MGEKWLPNERYVTKPGKIKSPEDEHTLDVAKKEVYPAVMTAQDTRVHC